MARDFISDWVVKSNYPGGYIRAIKHMLTSPAIPKSLGGQDITPSGNDDSGPGIPCPMVKFSSDPLGTAVPMAITFNAGTKRLESANQLAQAILFYDIWVDETPAFRSDPKPFWSTTTPAIGWDYSPTPTTSIVDGTIKQEGAQTPEQITFDTSSNPFHQDHDVLIFQATDTKENGG